MDDHITSKLCRRHGITFPHNESCPKCGNPKCQYASPTLIPNTETSDPLARSDSIFVTDEVTLIARGKIISDAQRKLRELPVCKWTDEPTEIVVLERNNKCAAYFVCKNCADLIDLV